ncbi:MAG: hypothetical protein QM820_21480 [Minicystis sp.]
MPVKAPSPLLGFNNNVRHKGRVFHIQTEDSGVRHPHIITHLFADGGRILKTTKTSYAEHVGQDRLAETVRQMMQEQHKAMFIALRDGQFDYLFEEGGAGPASQVAPQPKPSAPSAAAPATPSSPGLAPPAAAAASAASAARPAAPPREPSPVPPPLPAAPPVPASPPVPAISDAVPAISDAVPASRKRAASRPKLDVDTAAIHGVGGTPDQPSIDLDLDALERAAAEAQNPFIQQIQDLPPPPAAVLGQKRPSPGSYSVRTPGQPGEPPPPAAPRHPSPRPPAPVAVPPAAARYAPSRPASIFATTRPQEGSSIFGEDLISEKSLDEVILSYLAEDLDAPGDKK